MQAENQEQELDSPERKAKPQESESSQSYHVVDVDQTYETLTEAEIQESQEFTSQPGTPLGESHILSEKNQIPDNMSTDGKIATRKPSLTSLPCDAGSPAVTGFRNTSALLSSVRSYDDKIKSRIQYENGEKGDLHPR